MVFSWGIERRKEDEYEDNFLTEKHRWKKKKGKKVANKCDGETEERNVWSLDLEISSRDPLGWVSKGRCGGMECWPDQFSFFFFLIKRLIR